MRSSACPRTSLTGGTLASFEPRLVAMIFPLESTSSTALGLSVVTLGRYAASGLCRMSNAPLRTRRPCGVSNGVAKPTTGAPPAAAGTTGETAALPFSALRRCGYLLPTCVPISCRLRRRDLQQATTRVEEDRGLVAAADDHGLEVARRHARIGELGGGLGALAGQQLGRVGLDEARREIGADGEPLLELAAAVALRLVDLVGDEAEREHPDGDRERDDHAARYAPERGE